MDANALLDDADACHDGEPQRAADLLRRIDASALAADRLPLLGFLLNHVLGEKFGDWAEAHTRQAALLTAAAAAVASGASGAAGKLPAVLHRHAAVAARLAGDAAAAAAHGQALAAAAGASVEQATALVALAAAALQAAGLPASAAGSVALAALASMAAPHWQVAGPLDAPAAAQCNNLGSALVDRPLADLADPALRQALALAAQQAQALWQRAGNWVHHERAAYLSAMAASALGDAAAALGHAQVGLALIDSHDVAGEQAVDRAFLGLEASFALERLGRADEAAAARARADALAAAFGDAGLEKWFAARVARNALLRG